MKKLILLLAVLCIAFTASVCSSAAESESGGSEESGASQKAFSHEFSEQTTWEKKKNSKFRVSYWTASAVYCSNPTHSAQQSLTLYVPEAYIRDDGTLDTSASVEGYTVETAPIIYWNSHGSYVGMAPFGIAGLSTRSTQKGWVLDMISHGFVVCMAGERGKQTTTEDGSVIGRGPIAIADLKAGVRFLKHNSAVIPGNTDRIVSVGTSSGGAMSALLGASGNSEYYTPYLEEMGAVMDETDDVFATMAYCPITDLPHADYAYEWMFGEDTEGLDDFQKALSARLRAEYASYVNNMGLTDEAGNPLTIPEDGSKSGSYYEWLAGKYEASFEDYAQRFETDYQGSATFANAGAADAEELSRLTYDAAAGKATLVTPEGYDSALDAMILSGFRSRQKSVTSFDSLSPVGTDNDVFGVQGTKADDPASARHFNQRIAELIDEMKDAFPDEYAQYYEAFYADSHNAEVEEWSVYLNAYSFLTGEAASDVSPHFRINMGVCDADTATAVSGTLALLLMKNGVDTEFNIRWGWGHNDCDTPTGLMDWVYAICE
ncbi:MAG: subtype B tannase [Clostridia bacterium]|nr:subtype B tannase [Clostridia bacterium]